VMPEVSTVYSDEGASKIVPYESKFAPLKVEFFQEKWADNGRHRAYIAVVKFREHEVKLSHYGLGDLVRRLGHVLLALTEDVEQ